MTDTNTDTAPFAPGDLVVQRQHGAYGIYRVVKITPDPWGLRALAIRITPRPPHAGR
jgi:hypothetical protein